MTRFCTQCGARQASEARFCDDCGTPLRVPIAPVTHASEAASSADSPAPVHARTHTRGRNRWLVLGGSAVLLLGGGATAWLLMASSGPSQADIRAAAEAWRQAHQTEWLEQKACVRNFNYAANPVFVDAYDLYTQRWLNALVEAGIYGEPVAVNHGFASQLRYAWGPQAKRYIRRGALCVADGLNVQAAQPMQPGQDGASSLPPGVPLPNDWAMARLTLQWSGVPDWARRTPVSDQFPLLTDSMQHTLLLRKTQQGWTLASEEDEQRLLSQRKPFDAKNQPGQASRPFGLALDEAAKAVGGKQTSKPTTWDRLLDGLKSWSRFGDPAQRLPAQFYDDLQHGRFDAVYAMLGPQMQLLGPDNLRLALRQAQVQIENRGRVRDISVTRVTDQGDVRTVDFTVNYGDGSMEHKTMLLGKHGDQWRILNLGNK